MNRTLFFCVVCFALSSCLNLQAKPAPKLECEEPVYDFGTVDGTKPVSHTFKIRNAGDAEMVIRKIHAPCGCTNFILPSKSVPPGETLSIPVTVSLSGRKGVEEKSVFVETNDPSGLPFQLTLRGVVGTGIEIQPPVMTLRKNLKSTEVLGEVTVRDLAKKPLALLEAKSAGGKLEITSTPLKDGDGFVLRATPSAKVSPGQEKDKIQVRLKGAGEKNEITIDALILVPAELIAAPSVIRLDTKAAAPLSRTIIVRSPGGLDFSVDAVELPVPSMTSKIEPMSPNATRVVIENIQPERELDGKKVVLRIGGSKPRSLEIPVLVPR